MEREIENCESEIDWGWRGRIGTAIQPGALDWERLVRDSRYQRREDRRLPARGDRERG